VTLPDLEKRAVTRFGLSFSEFWDSTPRELELLLEGRAYEQEMGMNRVRHLMATMLNTVSRKKYFKPEDMIKLPLIDGNYKSEDEVKKAQEEAEQALIRFKKRHNGS